MVYLATTLYDGSYFQSDYGQEGKETSTNTRKWITMGAIVGAGAGAGAGGGSG